MSFSAEMRDFIGAYEKGTKIMGAQTDEEYKKAQTEHLKKKTETEFDEGRLKTADEQAQANLAKTRAGTGLIGEQIKNAGTNRAYTGAITDRLRRADQAIGGYQGNLPTAPGIGPAVGSAQPLPQVAIQPQPKLPGVEYAEGGVVPDLDVPEEEAPVGAIPDTPAPVGGPTDVSARRRQPQQPQEVTTPVMGYDGVISPLLVSDAVRGGYKYGTQKLGMAGRGTGGRARQGAMQMAQGVDALSPEEMDLARKAVDPNGRMTESQRNMAALGSVYQHWANKGDPQRADKVAFQMMQHFRLAAQRYAAIAAAAAEKGNMDMATKAALKAYANVPDGRDMQVTVGEDGKMQYHYTDETGKTISKGVASPQEFAAAAMGLTRGGFDQAILSSAGAREAAAKGTARGEAAPKGKAAVGDKVTDATNREEFIATELTKLQDAWKKKNEGKEIDDTYWGNLKDSATHIMQQNPNATPREALAASQALADPKRSSDYKTTSENGVNTIKFKDGAKITIDDDTFDVLINRRTEARAAQDQADAKAKADAEEAAKPSRIVEGAKRVAAGAVGAARSAATEGVLAPAREAVVDLLKKNFGPHVPPGLAESINGLIEKAKSGARSAGASAAGAVSNPNTGAIPDTYDSPL